MHSHADKLCWDACFQEPTKAAGYLCDKMCSALQGPQTASDAASSSVCSCAGVQPSALKMKLQAERRFERTKLQHDTRKAWLAYAHRQAAAVSEMRTPSERRRTDAALWMIFLANMESASYAHSAAHCTYWQDQDETDALPVQARITKLIPVVMEYLECTVALTTAARERETAEFLEWRLAKGVALTLAQREKITAEMQKARMAAEVAGGGKRPGKRRADHLEGPRAQRQRVAGARRQPESSTVYSAVPVDQHNALQCPDVGYQSNTESRPYSHSLRACLLAERRCLVCWATSHSIWNCPQSSQALRGELQSERCALPTALR